MSPRTVGRLAAALALLAAAWGVWTALESRASRPRPLFPDAAAARRLAVSGPEGSVRLAKEDGAWSLAEPFAAPADAAFVASALESLAAARLSAPLSDDPARLGLFGLEDARALRVDADGRVVLVGLPAADPSAAFVREPGSAVVREASGMSRWRQGARAGAWADKTLAAVEGARVTRLTVRTPKGVWDLRRGEPGWERAERALSALTRFTADEALDAASLEAEPRARLERVELAVEVETLDYQGVPGTPAVSLTVSPQGQDFRHLARVKGRDGVVYALAPWRLEPLRPQ